MSTSAKPSGLSISRKGDKYIFSWKKGGTYGDGQQLQYSYATAANQGSTIKIVQSKVIKLGASKTKKAVTIKSDIQYDPDNPNAKKFVQQVSFAVRGKADGKKWSAWVPYALNMDAPVGLQVKADWDTATPNKTTFTYSVKDDDEFPFDHIEFQTVRVSDCPENFKAEEFWKDAEVRMMSDKSGTLFDDPEAGLSGSMTRLVRVKAVGVAGETGWYYQYHVYAQPYAASVISAKADFNSLTGFFDAAMEWTIQHNKTQHPVGKQIVRYCIGTPTAGLGLPTSPDWQDADTPVITSPDEYTIEELYTEDTSGIAAAQSLRGYMVESTGNEPEVWRGQIGRALTNDECLWVRIKTQHDNNNNFSVPANLVSKGPLAKPTLTISANKNTHTIAVTSTNASSVPDAQVAFVYQDPVTNESAVLGIRTGNVTNMIVPAWTDEPGMVGAYAFVGSYIAQPARTDGTIVYSVLADWQSDTEWAQSPQAPTLSVRKYDDTTAALTWNWPYKEAMSAEVSWSDHEDAWESTDRPNTYDIQNYQAAKWNISNLESGKVWYFRVRLYYGDGESAIYGSYSNTESLDLTVPPVKPVLTLSDQIITGTGSVTANWYSPDNQEYAVIAELIDGEPRLLKQVGAEKGVTLYAAAPELEWETGTKHDLVVMYSANNRQSEWSDPVTLTIAEPLSCTISETSLENTTISLDPQVESGSLIALNGGDETNVRDVTSLQVSLEPVQAGTPAQGSEASDAYLMKASPTDDFNSEYLKIVGGTVAWNQLMPISGIDSTTTVKGVTFTNNGDGTVTINGTATDTISGNDYRAISPQSVISGHKYLFRGCPSGGSRTTYFMYDGYQLRDTGNGTVAVPQLLRCVFYAASGTVFNNVKFVPQIFDLTQMFGTTIADYIYSLEQATAGAGVAWFKKLFPKPYYAYNAGELMSVQASSHDMVGFNQFDKSTATDGKFINPNGVEVASRNYGHSDFIKVLPNTKYYMTGYAGASYYSVLACDINKNPIPTFYGGASKTEPFECTLPSNCYWAILNYLKVQKDTVCFNLSWDGSRDGEYEPYVKHEYPLDSDLELRGIPKLDSNNNLYYDGDTYEPDGTVTRKYGVVDLGTLDPIASTLVSNGVTIPISDAKAWTGGSYMPNGKIVGYTAVKTNESFFTGGKEWTLRQAYNNGGVLISDPSWAGKTVDEIKASLSGVYYVYELATPTTETADTFTSPQTAYPYGTESFTDTRAVQIPVGTTHRYASVYPITGHDSVGANVTGVNVWDEEWEVGLLDASTGLPTTSSQYIRSKNFCECVPNTAYYAQITSPYLIKVLCYDADKNFIEALSAVGRGTFTTSANAHYFKIETWSSAYGTTYNNDISINYPSTDHDYHAYTGSTYTAALPETVYGGNAELVGGTGKSTMGMQVITASMISIYNSYDNVEYAMVSKPTDAASRGNTNKYELLSDSYEVSDTYRGGTWNSAENVGYLFYSFASTHWVIGFPSGTTLAEMQTALEGVQICYELATPTDLSFTPQSITLNEGTNNVWSENGDVTIRTVEGYEDVLALRRLPLDVTVLGAGIAGNTMLAITRAEDFFLERPDEKETGGFKGDTVVQVNQSGEAQITIERDDLIDTFDDGAKYLITASVQDGFGQSATATLEFMVVWEHQALPAEGTARVEDGVGKIRAIKPSTALDTDTVDIYRLSADAPELIYKGAPFNQTIIDPYPTIGEFGGYRIVLVTADGDYITQDNEPDWLDIQAGLDTLFQYIDFAGRELELKYNVDLDSAWAKKFHVTNYLGGGVEGFWEEGINRNDSVKGVVPLDLDPDTYELVHRLGRYLGKCQVRTKAGSNFTANIDVSENSTFNSPAHPHSVSFGITKIDNTSLDGMTEEDWQNGL